MSECLFPPVFRFWQVGCVVW